MVSGDKEYLLSLGAVRERCFMVQEAGARNRLKHFDVDFSKLDDMVQIVLSLIKRDFANNPRDIPVHGRWRDFDAAGRQKIQGLINAWASLGEDPMEQTRRLIDLLVVAVLLDLVADPSWYYRERITGRMHKWNEGTAVACFDMFSSGVFSSDPSKLHRVDADALLNVTLETLSTGFQANDILLPRLADRVELLHHLGHLLKSRQDYFGSTTVARPGNLMDYLMEHPTTINTKKGPLIHLETLWPIMLEMGELWAAADRLGGMPDVGDVWPCDTIATANGGPMDHFVPFHRLSQSIAYSIIDPMEKLLGAMVEGTEQLTVLPEYRNGGLLIDSGFLTLKPADLERGLENFRRNSLRPGQPKIEVTPMFDVGDPAVVEWRALTVAYLDIVADRVRKSLQLNREDLSLSQLIHGGTSSAGRELAEISRPNTQEPPIVVKVDKRVVY